MELSNKLTEQIDFSYMPQSAKGFFINLNEILIELIFTVSDLVHQFKTSFMAVKSIKLNLSS